MIVDVQGIPLRRRDGTVLYALVDAEDFAWLNDYRWCLLEDGPRCYVHRNITLPGSRKGRVYMHRQILGLGAADKIMVDHINRNPLDNRRANLRIGSNAENSQNKGASRGGSSRFRGVSWVRSRRKWLAGAMLNGRHHHLGEYETETEAAAAAAAFRRDRMPFSEEARA